MPEIPLMRIIPNQGRAVWTTIQGEGVNAGVPSQFLRFAGCNLRCKWCDEKSSLPDYDLVSRRLTVKPTDHAWEVRMDDTVAQIAKNVERGYRHLVITGGEPMLHQERIMQLLLFLPDEVSVTVETNCEIMPQAAVGKRVTLASLSPKVHRWNPRVGPILVDVFKKWSEFTETQLKIVVQNDSDMHKAVSLIKEFRDADTLFRPWESVQVEWDSPVSSYMIEEAAALGVRLTKQLHKAMGLP